LAGRGFFLCRGFPKVFKAAASKEDVFFPLIVVRAPCFSATKRRGKIYRALALPSIDAHCPDLPVGAVQNRQLWAPLRWSGSQCGGIAARKGRKRRRGRETKREGERASSETARSKRPPPRELSSSLDSFLISSSLIATSGSLFFLSPSPLSLSHPLFFPSFCLFLSPTLSTRPPSATAPTSSPRRRSTSLSTASAASAATSSAASRAVAPSRCST